MTKMFDPPHPGLIVASELDYLHIGEKEFADKIGVDSESVAKILRAVAPITPDIAGPFGEGIERPRCSHVVAYASQI